MSANKLVRDLQPPSRGPLAHSLRERRRSKEAGVGAEYLMSYGRRFMTLYRRQGSRPSLWKRNAKKAKWSSEEALQTAEKRSEKPRRK